MLSMVFNRQDWETESAIMGSIYEGPYLTIAASTSSSDQQGFLEDCESRFEYLSWDLCWEDSSLPSGIKVRSIHDARGKFLGEPLSTRAWTLQERLLPRRLLTYSAALMWECTAELCECGSGLFPDPFLADSSHFYWPSRQKYKEVLTWKVEHAELYPYHYWNTYIVEPYMERSITNESDCLPAISAIASKIQTATGDQYLAGLWKMGLAQGLLWTKSHPGQKLANFRAPSWSWASCNGSVRFAYGHRDREESQITILKAECMLQGIDAFGEVSGGFLHIYGRVMPAMLLESIVRVLRGGHIDDSSTALFFPDAKLKEANAVDRFGKTYRTVRRAG
jgi:hypothetical protein